MTKLTITEAVKVIPVSESKLRRDMKAGVVSFEVDEKGKKRFDLSELARVYGQIDLAENNGQVKESNPPLSETGHDNPKVVALLENQIADLKSQLEHANAEKKELLELANRLQKQNEVLMLPNSEKAERKDKGWLLRLIGAR